MASSSRALPDQAKYQGYPYMNPSVTDVQSIDAATAARWANLPRRPITTPAQRSSSKASNQAKPDKKEDSRTNETDEPQVDQEKAPVIYVPLPDETSSGCSTLPRESENGDDNPDVQGTIFFDPFENRQIDVTSPRTDTQDVLPALRPPTRPPPPIPETRRYRPPSTLSNSSGSSAPGTSNNTPAYQTDYVTTESLVYRQPPLDEFPPMQYPVPPPAYSEVDRLPSTSPPRTVVVVPPGTSPAVGLPRLHRQLVFCQDCGLRVHTMVIKENGIMTHFIALITVLLCLFPLTAVVYCTDICKYLVHYCPNCNFKIGYEVPLLCQDMVYTSNIQA